MSKLVPPHGGKLTSLLVPEEQQSLYLAKAKTLPVVRMSSRETSDLLMLGIGAFSPLTGFMGQEDYESVVKTKHLADGTAWPVPITLSVREDLARNLRIGSEVALVDDETGFYVGVLKVQEKYHYDKVKECKEVFFTDDTDHPGVQKVMAQPEVNLGGPVITFSQMGYDQKYGTYYATPEQTRSEFDRRGWKTVAAFQTRNPLHRSHEYLCKIGNEICDGLLLHPIVGKLKEGDIPAEIRLRCYEELLNHYFNPQFCMMKVYPMEMRYAGPSEGILHAIIRQNFGCSHLLVGRDHAGVGSYYTAYQAQELFEQFKPGEILCQPIKVTSSFYCRVCGGMTTEKTCCHDSSNHLTISGTKLRSMLSAGEFPPSHFSRPEVLQILMNYYQGLNGQKQ